MNIFNLPTLRKKVNQLVHQVFNLCPFKLVLPSAHRFLSACYFLVFPFLLFPLPSGGPHRAPFFPTCLACNSLLLLHPHAHMSAQTEGNGMAMKKGEDTKGPACVEIMQGVEKPRAHSLPPFIILSSRALSLSLYNNQRLRGVPLLAIDPSSPSSSSFFSFLLLSLSVGFAPTSTVGVSAWHVLLKLKWGLYSHVVETDDSLTD